MAYDQNIPQATAKLKNSQPKIKDNFQALKTLIDVNHGTFGAADQGKHKFVTMPEQSPNGPATSADEMALYTKAVAGVTQMFLRRENVVATGAEIDFTSATANSSNGTLTLPCGIILKWGKATTTTPNGTKNISFATAFPNNIFAAYAVTSTVSGTAPKDDAKDRHTRVYKYVKASMDVVCYGPSSTRPRVAQEFCWFAIGN